MTNNYRVVGMVQLVQLLSTFTAEQRTLSRRCPSLTSIIISITFILWINISDICDKTVQVRVRDALHNTCGVPPPWRISWWALGFDFDNYLSGILHWTLISQPWDPLIIMFWSNLVHLHHFNYYVWIKPSTSVLLSYSTISNYLPFPFCGSSDQFCGYKSGVAVLFWAPTLIFSFW